MTIPAPAPHTHVCPGGCGERVAYTRLACRACWARLPKPLQLDINSTYRKRRIEPMDHMDAVREAVRWYRANPIDTPTVNTPDNEGPHHAPQ